jgi:branched-chain amino acid transport system substrate-binding protein
MGAEVVAEEYLNPNDQDFKPLITGMRSREPDTVLLALFQVEAALLFQQAREMGFSPTWMSGASLFNPQLLELAGDAADGLLLVSAFYADSDRPQVHAFVEAYESRYGSVPSKFAAHSYDGVRLIADAMRRAGSAEGAAVRDALAQTEGFEGVIGTVTMDAAREIEIDLARLQVKDAQFAPWSA